MFPHISERYRPHHSSSPSLPAWSKDDTHLLYICLQGTQKVLSSLLRRFHFLLLAVSNFIMVWYAFQLWSGHGHRTHSQSYISLSFEATQHIQTKGPTDRIGVSLQAKRRPFSVKFPDQTSKQIRLRQRIYVYKARPNIFANYIYLIAHEQLRYEDEVSLTQLI